MQGLGHFCWLQFGGLGVQGIGVRVDVGASRPTFIPKRHLELRESQRTQLVKASHTLPRVRLEASVWSHFRV